MSETEQPECCFKAVFLAILLLAVLCLLFSLFAQFLAGFKPCKLCLIQRYIYLGLGCLSLWWLIGRQRWLRVAIPLILAVGLFVASYQSLAYFGLIDAKCSMHVDNIFKQTSPQGVSVSAQNCSSHMLNFAGIPLSLINAIIYSIFLGILIVKEKLLLSVKLK
ncbi:MAG TPA: disulfide bond formation protein B [Candidatus Babeliaceae bacterium]|nr:disulfide bond formation protein B [Candidatus Babeliaceae bacterium]